MELANGALVGNHLSNAANSIFVGDYLTTMGQEETEDYKMLRDLGFEIETIEEMKESLVIKK